MSNEFGHWLAGFIAGEGCFTIQARRTDGLMHYYPRFSLKVREDDGAVIREIVARTGIGYIKWEPGRKSSRPGIAWLVFQKFECLRLVEYLDHLPLRAKKARDYAVWRKAVLSWLSQLRGNRWHGAADQSEMLALKEELETLKVYAPQAPPGDNYPRGAANRRIGADRCARGHLYDGPNTRIDRSGHRRCRACYNLARCRHRVSRQTDSTQAAA